MEEDEASDQERAGVTMNDDDDTRVERKSAFMGLESESRHSPSDESQNKRREGGW